MGPHVVDDLSDFALGALDDVRRAWVEAHLAGCPDCAGAFADLAEILAILAGPAPAPSDGLRARVLGDVRARLAVHTGAVARLFSMPPDEAEGWLDRLDVPDAWVDAPFPGTFAVLVGQEGARLHAFIRVPRGVAVPRHEHHGVEHTLVLGGALLDDAGRVWTPGELMTMPAGSRHTFCAFGDRDCVCAVLLEGGYSLAA